MFARLIAIAIVGVASTPVGAENIQREVPLHEYCRAVAKVASAAMEARQGGIDPRYIEEKLDGNAWMKALAAEAIRAPLRLTKPAQKSEIAMFVEDWTARCYRRDLP